MKFFSKVAKQFVCAAFVLACLTFITVLPAYAFDATQARADNIVITSGSFSATPGASVNTAFSFSGQGFAASGGRNDGNVPASLCNPCQAGTALSLDGLFNSSDLGFGAVTINNTNYPRLYFGGGTFKFSAGSIVLPSTDSSLVTITTPFDFTGALNGYNNSLAGDPGAPVFSTTLTGQGTTTVQFSTQMDGTRRLFFFRGITYNFQSPTPTSTPPANFEPVTLTADQSDFDIFTFRDRAIVRLRLTFSDASYRIVDFGRVAKTGNDFTLDVKAERFTGGGAPQVIVKLIRIYELSNLAPGDYTFTLKSRDTFVRRKNFTVTSGISFFKGNPIDEPAFFVDQHYRDFLNRAPDDGGLNYWSDQFSRCEKTNDAQCMSDQRVSISAAFFIEQEFQETGSFVYRMYKGTLNRQPAFNEFMTEREQVIGGANLDASKQTFADAFVQRPEFLQKYPQSLTQEQFVDALAATIKSTSGVNLSAQRSAYLSALQTGGRGLVVRQIIEDQSFQKAEYNRAFVLMQYFGYLRRDPDAEGYKFWIDVLDNRVPNNYRSMVNAFITSTEYRARFTN